MLELEGESLKSSAFGSMANLGPFLQGALMEEIDPAYAERLHGCAFNPYSQYCVLDKDTGKLLWRINALNDEAADCILAPLSKKDSVSLRAKNLDFEVVKRSTESVSMKSLTDLISGGGSRLSVRFITPTAFKSGGAYVIIPSPRLIAQNLLMHYGQVFSGSNDVDAETLEYLEKHLMVSSYRLRSSNFGNVAKGGRGVPGFEGSLTLAAAGPDMVGGLMAMLLKFGEYAGVGIKTAMGMGAVSC